MYCRHLKTISIVILMRKRNGLLNVQKGIILSFRVEDGSISETAQFVNCSHAAMVKVCLD